MLASHNVCVKLQKCWCRVRIDDARISSSLSIPFIYWKLEDRKIYTVVKHRRKNNINAKLKHAVHMLGDRKVH